MAVNALPVIFYPNFLAEGRVRPMAQNFEFPVSLFIFQFSHAFFFFLFLFLSLGFAFEFNVRFGNQNLAAFVKAAGAAGAVWLDRRHALWAVGR